MLERQWRQRMAGLRTNALATGASLFASTSILMDAKQNPTQVAVYIVSGIGFLAGAVARMSCCVQIVERINLKPFEQPNSAENIRTRDRAIKCGFGILRAL